MVWMRMLVVVVCGLVLASGAQAVAADGVKGPTPYPESEKDWPGKGVIRTFPYMAGIRASFWKQREKDQGAVVFVGSSSTESWKSVPQAFPQLKTANRGIGGDTSRGALFRFQEDVLDLHPKAIVMLIGQNDLTAHGAPADTASNIETMLTMAEKQNQQMPIILCTIPPSANPKAPVRAEQRQALNAKIAELAAQRQNRVLCDVYAAMANPDGSPIPQYFGADLLHFGPGGHAKWAELLKPILDGLQLEQGAH